MQGSWPRIARLGLCILLAAAAANPTATARSGNLGYCFGPDDGARAPFRVVRYPSRPPRGEVDRSFKWYPMTDAADSDASTLTGAGASHVRRNFFVWANDCEYVAGLNTCRVFRTRQQDPFKRGGANPPPRPMIEDPQSGRDMLFDFTSYAAADACTLIQTAWALGAANARIDQMTVGSGLTVVRDRARAPLMMDHDAQDRFQNVCVMPSARLDGGVRGVILDYEVHDGRGARAARDFLLAFAALVHREGREAILYTNPLDAPIQRFSGLGPANLNEIQAAFDATTVLLYRRYPSDDFAREYASQRRLLEGARPVKPPIVTFDLARSTLADAAATRAIILRDHLPGVIVFQKTAELDGPCDTDPNRKLACFVYGRCQ